ncbi:hypothetical protein VPH35_096773 [Triticum aestivum]
MRKNQTNEAALDLFSMSTETTPLPPSQIPSPPPIYSLSLRRREPCPSLHRGSFCWRRGPRRAATAFIADPQDVVGTPPLRSAIAAVEVREGHDPRVICIPGHHPLIAGMPEPAKKSAMPRRGSWGHEP